MFSIEFVETTVFVDESIDDDDVVTTVSVLLLLLFVVVASFIIVETEFDTDVIVDDNELEGIVVVTFGIGVDC